MFLDKFMKLSVALFLLTQVECNPQFLTGDSGLLGLGNLFGNKEPSGSPLTQQHQSKAAIENVQQNQQFGKQKRKLIYKWKEKRKKTKGLI